MISVDLRMMRLQKIPQFSSLKAQISKNLGWHGIPRVKESLEIGTIRRPGAKPHTKGPKGRGKMRKSGGRKFFYPGRIPGISNG